MPKTLLTTGMTILLLVCLPLLGIIFSGEDITVFTSFPPYTHPVGQASFSWPVALLLFLVFAVTMVLLVWGWFKSSSQHSSGRNQDSNIFPPWGWLSIVLLILIWHLAWSRYSWFALLQPHTFTPLWLCYILLINAVTQYRTGQCFMVKSPLLFLALFPVSSIFWWYFEYINQFVHNWYYSGVDYGPFKYSLYATISFSTVLPAIYSTQQLIYTLPFVQSRFLGLPAAGFLQSRIFATFTLMLSGAGLLAISFWPRELYPLLWLAPLFILTALQTFVGRAAIFEQATTGDYRLVVSSALAALMCGFFWEMWNYNSLAKWIYTIPYAHTMKLFEMPLLGYQGYLPFGLECMAVVLIVKRVVHSS